MTVYSKYHYEKKWTETSVKEIERMISQELPDAPVEDTLKYILQSCKAGKSVSLIDVSFTSKI